MGKPLRPRNLHFVAKHNVTTENFITLQRKDDAIFNALE